MRIDFYANLRHLTGQLAFEFAAGSSLTVQQAIEAVAAHFPMTRAVLLDARGCLRPEVPLFVNGRNPRLLSLGLETPLAPADVVSVFSPIASGRLNVETLTAAHSGGHAHED